MARINGTDKSETLNGTSSADVIKGFGGNDTLNGLDGPDILDGGTGNDMMAGGQGNDIYYITSSGDRVTEGNRGGTDEVRTTLASYTLGANVENLRHTVNQDFSGSGNALNNMIMGGDGNDNLRGLAGNDKLYGFDGNDVLDGGLGNDLMVGGNGGDVYYVDSVRDQVVEGNRGGTDEVRTVLSSYALGSNVENLTYVGSQLFTGAGNALNNVIKGGALGDVLMGAGGNDRLFGGVGNDTAMFSGKRADYTITTVGSTTTVVDNNADDGNDGKDTLNGVERLKFADESVPVGVISSVVLADLDGIKGFTLLGVDPGDYSGFSVSSAGDLNGDGFDDLIVGAPYAESVDGSEGESYVVFGKPSWAGTPSVDLASLNGSNGFRIVGIDAGDRSGGSVSSAGDVNGDGFADLIVGARFAKSSGAVDTEGESYVVFGKANWTGTPALDLATLDGTVGFRMVGEPGVRSGYSVASAGDVNSDGLADLIVSAPRDRSYVVFGKVSWTGQPEVDLGTLDGTDGFRLIETDSNPEAYNSVSVSSAGDVNGDGIADMIIGGPEIIPGEPYGAGESFVVFGKLNWSGSPSINLAALDGTDGFRLSGADPGDSSGFSVSSGGDVNGDGFADLLVGAPNASGPGGDFQEGEAYVIFGKANWTATPALYLGALNGENGFSLTGVNGNAGVGRAVSSAGDVNGDGFDDLIVGGAYATGTGGQGERYVIYGKADWTALASLDLATLDGTNGFRLLGIDTGNRGHSVSAAGDVNGDGFADLIVGAPVAGGDTSESYVIFGGNFTGAVTHVGGTGGDILSGSAAAESFVGGLGTDTLIGAGGADSFQGGAGDDVMRIASVDFHLADGGTGTDTLELEGSGLDLDLTATADSRTSSIERVDITGSGDNSLSLSVRDVLNLSEDSNELLVLGNAGDVVDRGSGWTMASSGGTNGDGTSTLNGQTYQIYTAGQATLLLDTDMTVAV